MSSTKMRPDPPYHPDLNKNYTHLSPEEVSHWLEHGWLRVPGALDPQILDKWVSELWVRTGYDEHDKSTWDKEYFHMPRHREVPAEEFCPLAWAKIKEICGGGLRVEDRVDPERETWYGDGFIVNWGTEEKTPETYEEFPPNEKGGWHIDDDWYRLFLDSRGTAMTLVHCYSDIPENGGGTWLCEDGIPGVNRYLYNHRQGLDPPFPWDQTVCSHIKGCTVFKQVTAKKGDVFILNGRLPHTVASNLLHYPRLITNPHVSLKEPMNFNRADGNYSLLEQSVLNSLGRTALPEYAPLREPMEWYPRNASLKLVRAQDELARMEAAAVAKGLPKESVDSLYQKLGSKEWKDYERRNGYDKPVCPAGVMSNDFKPGGKTATGLESGRFASRSVKAH